MRPLLEGLELSNLVLHNEVIRRVEKIKYLGSNIDESLNWEEQYKTMKNKFKGGISSLKNLKDILRQRKLEQVYKVFFESHLRYGDIAWSALSNTKLSKLQRLQIRARKLIENAKYKDGWNCNWLDVKSLISFDQGVMTYKKYYMVYVLTIFAINLLKDPWFLSIKREIIEISKFPKLG